MSPTLVSVLAFVLLIQVVVGVPPYFYDGYATDERVPERRPECFPTIADQSTWESHAFYAFCDESNSIWSITIAVDQEDLALEGPSDIDRGDLSVDRLLQGYNKRSCIRRGARCDHRKDDCCSGGACRCNLWGTNCQCQRMGIFQKWG